MVLKDQAGHIEGTDIRQAHYVCTKNLLSLKQLWWANRSALCAWKDKLAPGLNQRWLESGNVPTCTTQLMGHSILFCTGEVNDQTLNCNLFFSLYGFIFNCQISRSMRRFYLKHQRVSWSRPWSKFCIYVIFPTDSHCWHCFSHFCGLIGNLFKSPVVFLVFNCFRFEVLL